MVVVFFFLILTGGLQTPEAAPHVGHQHIAADAVDSSRIDQDTVCGDGEYLVDLKCCKACHAGTYMHEKCQVQHGENVCRSCTAGEDYTSGPNALTKCNRCSRCRNDQVMIENCTIEKNAQCECKPGYYCHETESCEMCVPCSRTCPDGQKPQRNCDCQTVLFTNSSPTMTSVTPSKPDRYHFSYLAFIIVVLTVLGFGLVWVCWYMFKKKGSVSLSTSDQDATNYDVCSTGCESEEGEQHVGLVLHIPDNTEMENSNLLKNPNSDDEDEEDEAIGKSIDTTACSSTACSSKESVPLAVQETGFSITVSSDPDQMCVTRSDSVHDNSAAFVEMPHTHQEKRRELVAVADDALQQSFDFVTEKVPSKHFKQLMRKLRLSNNEIDEAVQNNPGNVREQNFTMLSSWYSKTGNDASINMILDALYKMELKTAAEAIAEVLIAEHLYR